MDNLELLINLIIVALLVPTILFAYRLNKNLEVLRRNQSSLAKLVEALNDATFKAENSIPKLKSVTEHSSEGLKEVVDSAKELKDDLLFINERADNLADRLEQVISDGRQIKTAPTARDQFAASLNRISSAADENKEETINIADSRSEAELELLKALRSIK